MPSMRSRPSTASARWRRWLVPAAVVYVIASIATAYTRPEIAVLFAVALVWLVRRSWRWRRFRHEYLAPTIAAISPPLGGVDVQLEVSASLGRLVPRLAHQPSPIEEKLRAWYGRRVEPVLRWAPDQLLRAGWALQRRIEPVLAQVRRPREDDDTGRIVLRIDAPFLTAEQRKFVGSVIAAKIPAGEVAEKWNMVGAAVKATWTVRRRPPGKVGAAEVRQALGSLKEWEFYLGATTGNRPVVVSLREDSPHIACSAGSGAGKSVLAQLIAVQNLARGGQVVILDRKGSHRWARNLDRVTYCTQPEAMHNALVELAQTADTRNQKALYEAEDWDPGERIFVICEELNATLAQLGDYWAEAREKGDPKVSPAIRGLRELLYMGRSAKVHVFAVAQMLSARAVGGPEARENFGIRCLARYTQNAWKMLVPEAAFPRASRTLGRWQVVVAGQATETQVAFLTAREARDISGVLVLAKVPDRPVSSNVPGDSPSSGDIADPLAEKITLREAVDEGLLPGRFEAAKKRLQRAKKTGGEMVPRPVGRRGLADLYTRGDLVVWAESEFRPAAP